MSKVCKYCGSSNCLKNRRMCQPCMVNLVREWRKKNPNKVKSYAKKQYNKNKDKFFEYRKKWLESKKDGKWRVYCLPNADYYVGYTGSWYERKINHKSKGNDSSDYIILHVCDTEDEAKWYESVYHKIGFRG